MNPKGMIVVKGSSATGKGTRVVQILEFLKTKYPHEVVTFEDKWSKKPKTRDLGVLFPDLNLMFAGTYTVSNKSGLTSWTSMDYLHSALLKGEIVRNLLKEYVDKGITLVCEGEPLMQSDKWRPKHMFDFYGLDFLSIIYFNYATREQYDDRVIGRSGKKAGDSGWSRNESYAKEFGWCIEEMKALGYPAVKEAAALATDYVMTTPVWSQFALFPHDAPLQTVGDVILETLVPLGKGRPVDDFHQYCEAHPMLRSIGVADPLLGRVVPKPVKHTERPAPAVEVSKPRSVNLLDRFKK